SYSDLQKAIDGFDAVIARDIPEGAVVSFNGDYSLEAIALFLALLRRRAIVVPLSSDSSVHFDEYRDIAQVEYEVSFQNSTIDCRRTQRKVESELYHRLRDSESAGLVLFSSGSTGKSKAIVQDLSLLLEKFRKPGKPQTMLIFLQLDHIGGINSLLYSLANGGTLVTPASRAPTEVATAIEKHAVELLPTSPTFVNLLLLSGALEQHDLSSLKLVTYGTEPMQESTLARFRAALPEVRLQQTYGLSEVGILRSRSRSSDSLWMQVGGAEFETKIQNGTLWIRAQSAMLGYLNAPSPFDDEGFFDTGDLVEQDGDWIRILGRTSEIINVGGQKVYPAEVESVLLNMDGVEDVVVFGQKNPITGAAVVAKFKISSEETPRALKMRVIKHCQGKLPSYKVPARVTITTEGTFNERFKRMRRPD
ncbi:MAG: fatty acid--CoA ligase family protein, partial [Congregibacter sp.]|nr:fatty acid--CoA ligase family protein [Congregibacter sp.]